MDVEAELALHGYSDPSASLFRGCQICLLPPSALLNPSTLQPSALERSDSPAGSSKSEQRLFQSTRELANLAADTEQALQDCQAKRVSLQVWSLSPQETTPQQTALAIHTGSHCMPVLLITQVAVVPDNMPLHLALR